MFKVHLSPLIRYHRLWYIARIACIEAKIEMDDVSYGSLEVLAISWRATKPQDWVSLGSQSQSQHVQGFLAQYHSRDSSWPVSSNHLLLASWKNGAGRRMYSRIHTWWRVPCVLSYVPWHEYQGNSSPCITAKEVPYQWIFLWEPLRRVLLVLFGERRHKKSDDCQIKGVDIVALPDWLGATFPMPGPLFFEATIIVGSSTNDLWSFTHTSLEIDNGVQSHRSLLQNRDDSQDSTRTQPFLSQSAT